MKYILPYLKPYRKKLIFVAILHIIATLSSLLMPYLMSAVVDLGIARGDRQTIVFYSLSMIALTLVTLPVSLLSNRINTFVTTGLGTDLSRGIFEKINSLSHERYSAIGSSSLLTRATDDVLNLQDSVSNLVYTVVTVPIMFIGGTVLCLTADTVLSLVFFLCIPPVIAFVFFVVKPLGGMWDKADAYIDAQNRIVRERLSGLRVVRAFNNEEREHARASEATRQMSKYMIRANVRSGLIEPVATLLLNLACVLILLVGASRIEGGYIRDAGSIIATVQYVTLIAGAIVMLSYTVAWIPHLKVSARRVAEVLAQRGECLAPTLSEEGTRGDALLELRSLSFRYPDSKREVLSEVSMRIHEGEVVAIIGGTGSGKSTLVRLLLALYEPSAGEILLRGRSYGAWGVGGVREHFSVALQKATVFEGTLRDNVRMGNEKADDGQIKEALSVAMLSDFLLSHEEGLDTLLVGGGRNVSGGQKQRINIARAVIRNADVYIFDDSFSALDFLTERRIKEKLQQYLPNKTQIIVTQRVSTSMSADRVFVMHEGRIVGEGTHESLYQSSDIYREICDSQIPKKGGEHREKA